MDEDQPSPDMLTVAPLAAWPAASKTVPSTLDWQSVLGFGFGSLALDVLVGRTMAVLLAVGVGVDVAVGVSEGVGVKVGVEVNVGVGVWVGVFSLVLVGVGLGVGVSGGGGTWAAIPLGQSMTKRMRIAQVGTSVPANANGFCRGFFMLIAPLDWYLTA